MDIITKNYMSQFLESEQIKETELSKQFELFASYCAIAQHYSETYNVEDIITGDGGDSGIDAMAIIVNGKMITSKEEIDDLVELNKVLYDINFIFVQAKSSSKFDYSLMGTFGVGVKDFFSERPQMIRNCQIQDKNSIVTYVFSKMKYAKNKPNCYLYYISTGKWVDDKNCMGRINIAVSDLEMLSIFANVKYIPVDADLLQKYYRSTIDATETEIEFNDRVILPEIQNVKQAFLGYLSHTEYLKLIVGENGDIRKNVFYDNVRDFQGDNPVNNEISETVCIDPNKFILFNNGVTIICKQLKNNHRNQFILTDYQIVNGCQTSHVLYNSRNNITSDLQIPVKLIETNDDETVNRIIKATNRQTEVTNDQLIALNEFHRKLEAFYSAIPLKERLYYERRSKQYNYDPNIEKVRIVSIGTQIKSVASMFYDKPHLASRFYGKVLNSVKDMFNEEHQLLPYYTCAYTLYRLEYLFRNKLLSLQYRKFKYHILMMLKYSIVPEDIPNMNSNKIEKVCNDILKVVKCNTSLTNEVKKLTSILDKNVPDLSSTESTKLVTLVEKLKSELKK